MLKYTNLVVLFIPFPFIHEIFHLSFFSSSFVLVPTPLLSHSFICTHVNFKKLFIRLVSYSSLGLVARAEQTWVGLHSSSGTSQLCVLELASQPVQTLVSSSCNPYLGIEIPTCDFSNGQTYCVRKSLAHPKCQLLLMSTLLSLSLSSYLLRCLFLNHNHNLPSLVILPFFSFFFFFEYPWCDSTLLLIVQNKDTLSPLNTFSSISLNMNMPTHCWKRHVQRRPVNIPQQMVSSGKFFPSDSL